MIKISALLFLFACTTEPPSPRPSYLVTWDTAGSNDSPDGPGRVVCTTTIARPCPFLLYTSTVNIGPGFGSSVSSGSVNMTWGDATGGHDLDGRTAESYPPTVDVATTTPDAITFLDDADDGGLRYGTTLARNADGAYEGAITWGLVAIPGHTTWNVTLTPSAP